MHASLLQRKVNTAAITIILFTLIITIMVYLLDDVQLASELIIIPFVVALYTTPFILIYGVGISMLIECTFSKKGIGYLLLHVLFGSVSFFLFWEWSGMIYGWVAALIYVVVEHTFFTKKLAAS